MIKRVFKKFFKKKSVQPSVVVKPKKNLSEGRIVEFIGPSGIGKTTLYNTIIKELTSNWINAKNFKEHEYGTANEELFAIHWKLLKYKLERVDSFNLGSLEKINLVQYFKQVLLENIKMINVKGKSGYLLEEGLCHNFSIELLNLNEKELKAVLGNRYIISVLPKDTKTVVNQIRKRTVEGGHTVAHHKNLNDEELEEYCKISTKAFEKFTNHIQKFNFPLCTLYVEDGIEFNSNKIIDFEKAMFK
ncbi:MAG: hypothetical protein ACPG6B_06930 [Oceanihabitans sp.]